jgi:hypothetical protein
MQKADVHLDRVVAQEREFRQVAGLDIVHAAERASGNTARACMNTIVSSYTCRSIEKSKRSEN